MSAGEVERLVSELSGGTGGDEEEEWLYGGTELPVPSLSRVLSGFPSRPANCRRPGPLTPPPAAFPVWSSRPASPGLWAEASS